MGCTAGLINENIAVLPFRKQMRELLGIASGSYIHLSFFLFFFIRKAKFTRCETCNPSVTLMYCNQGVSVELHRFLNDHSTYLRPCFNGAIPLMFSVTSSEVPASTGVHLSAMSSLWGDEERHKAYAMSKIFTLHSLNIVFVFVL